MQINTSIEIGVGGQVDVETLPRSEGDLMTATTLGVATSEGQTLTETTTPKSEGDTLTATTLGVATSEGQTLTETTTEE